jgi:hypothetical protein
MFLKTQPMSRVRPSYIFLLLTKHSGAISNQVRTFMLALPGCLQLGHFDWILNINRLYFGVWVESEKPVCKLQICLSLNKCIFFP